jgi:hypothetical protein
MLPCIIKEVDDERRFLLQLIQQCPDVPVKYIDTGITKNIVKKSEILSGAGDSMLDKILAGKQVV